MMIILFWGSSVYVFKRQVPGRSLILVWEYIKNVEADTAATEDSG